LSAIEAKAGGVPLFVTSLARQFHETGELGAPAVVRDVILERLDRRSAGERAVVDLLAIHAEPLAHDVLRLAAGRPEPDLLASPGRWPRPTNRRGTSTLPSL